MSFLDQFKMGEETLTAEEQRIKDLIASLHPLPYYRFIDQIEADQMKNRWIDGIIDQLGRHRAFCSQDEGRLLDQEVNYRVLWFRDRPLAVALVMRDAMNYSCLFTQTPISSPDKVDWKSRCKSLELENAALRVVIDAHVEWESDIIQHADWDTNDGLPHLTQDLMDSLTFLQNARNAVLKPDSET